RHRRTGIPDEPREAQTRSEGVDERAEADALHGAADIDRSTLHQTPIIEVWATIRAVRDFGRILATALIVIAACRQNREIAQPVPLVVSLNGDPGPLNPAVTTSGNTHPVTDQIFNGLVGLDESLQPVPELAERWRIEDSGRVYRFGLRKDVRWHDGGAFTSAD